VDGVPRINDVVKERFVEGVNPLLSLSDKLGFVVVDSGSAKHPDLFLGRDTCNSGNPAVGCFEDNCSPSLSDERDELGGFETVTLSAFTKVRVSKIVCDVVSVGCCTWVDVFRHVDRIFG